MNRRSTLGIVGVLAVTAMLGLSMKTGSGGGGLSSAERPATVGHSNGGKPKAGKSDESKACDDLVGTFKRFFGTEELQGPESCGGTKNPISRMPLDLKFVIATLPDPVHTHLPLMFDRATEVIQEAAQDENYSYESSWLPWDDKEQSYQFLSDEDKASDRKEFRENQPGILIFRKGGDTNQDLNPSMCQNPDLGKNPTLRPYQKGLIVFVVGEDPTSGIHTDQFKNAWEWINDLKSLGRMPCAPAAILGPTFSGSFPSLEKLLVIGIPKNSVKDILGAGAHWLSVYSGSANSGSEIAKFKSKNSKIGALHDLNIQFHGFMERDEVGLERYAEFVNQQGYSPTSIAILSEDETAYGNATFPSSIYRKCEDKEGSSVACLSLASFLYYPRDISALRAAYQSNSLFSSATPQQSSGNLRGSLPNDLADPEGIDHDTIQSYGGNQTTQSQEAYLLSLVETLQQRQIQYVILRGSNVLDELFLAQYLRRTYPVARIVVDGADRLFERERGALGVAGTLTLSTYPLMEQEQEWIDGAAPSPGRRLFNSESSEGTYTALRLLLNTRELNADPVQAPNSPRCILDPEIEPVDPASPRINGTLSPLPVACSSLKVPIPDYATPHWMKPVGCESDHDGCDAAFRRPTTWLSVLGRDGYWPIAALNEITTSNGNLMPPRESEPQSRLPTSLKLILIFFGLFITFYAWLCSYGASYTTKPAFRTFFAGPRDIDGEAEWKHPTLICLGSAFLALMPLFVAWGCGLFEFVPTIFSHAWVVGMAAFLESLAAIAAVTANVWRVQTLNPGYWNADRTDESWGNRAKWSGYTFIAVFAFVVFFAWLLQDTFKPANRFFTYDRSMDIFNGVSPIMPLMLLALGMFAWFWYTLHGLALFGKDRCLLPPESDLKLSESDNYLRMFSRECAAIGTEKIATPLSGEALAVGTGLVIVAVIVLEIVFGAFPSPIRSLGNHKYSNVICWWIFASFVVMLTEAWQLWRTWAKLKELLAFLDRMRLRRTISALRSFTWGSVWSMSGNVLDVRYKLLSRQLESLGHARASLLSHVAKDTSTAAQHCIAACLCIGKLNKLIQRDVQVVERSEVEEVLQDSLQTLHGLPQLGLSRKFSPQLKSILDKVQSFNSEKVLLDKNAASCIRECTSTLEEFIGHSAKKEVANVTLCIVALDRTHDDGVAFARWYADHYDKSYAGDFSTLEIFQKSVAKTAATLLKHVLLPEWRTEVDSLISMESKVTGGDGDVPSFMPPQSSKKYIQDTEEFVCLPYMGFVQNILGRMRTIVLSIVFLFVATAAAISSYPFDPRPGIAAVLLAVFVVLGTAVTYVYARMHQDSTLSLLTNTKPGELGLDFWFRLAATGAAPIVGLLATFFPEISNLLSTWLPSGLQSMK